MDSGDRIGRSCMRCQKRKYKMRMLLSVKIHEQQHLYYDCLLYTSFAVRAHIKQQRLFLTARGLDFPTYVRYASRLQISITVLPMILLPRLLRVLHPRIPFPVCVPTVLFICGTGISTCQPSTTSFDLALGPDLPRAYQLYSGNLRYFLKSFLVAGAGFEPTTFGL